MRSYPRGREFGRKWNKRFNRRQQGEKKQRAALLKNLRSKARKIKTVGGRRHTGKKRAGTSTRGQKKQKDLRPFVKCRLIGGGPKQKKDVGSQTPIGDRKEGGTNKTSKKKGKKQTGARARRPGKSQNQNFPVPHGTYPVWKEAPTRRTPLRRRTEGERKPGPKLAAAKPANSLTRAVRNGGKKKKKRGQKNYIMTGEKTPLPTMREGGGKKDATAGTVLGVWGGWQKSVHPAGGEIERGGGGSISPPKKSGWSSIGSKPLWTEMKKQGDSHSGTERRGKKTLSLGHAGKDKKSYGN